MRPFLDAVELRVEMKPFQTPSPKPFPARTRERGLVRLRRSDELEPDALKSTLLGGWPG